MNGLWKVEGEHKSAIGGRVVSPDIVAHLVVDGDARWLINAFNYEGRMEVECALGRQRPTTAPGKGDVGRARIGLDMTELVGGVEAGDTAL